MSEKWVRTDEAEDVAGSIRHAIRAAQFVKQDPQAWKWLVLALHSALQGACVCHLTTTAAPLGGVSRRNAKEWLKYFEDQRVNANAKQPKTFLMCLPDLLKAVREPDSAGDRSDGSGVEISASELDWLIRFHKIIRNQFTHFEPMVWSLEVSGMPEITKLIARIIKDILEVGWAFRHLAQEQRDELQKNVKVLETIEYSC